MKLPFQRPRPPLLSEVGKYYELSEEARYYSNGGPCVRLLKERLSALLGGLGVVPVTNATIGLEVAITATIAARVPHRVVMPSFTFPATALAASRLGHRPVFVDVDPETWQIDAAQVDRALSASNEPTIVMGCTTFGTPPGDADLAHLAEVCAARGVGLVMDAAAALSATTSSGAWYGPQADMSVFSLHVTKTASASEGGFILARSVEKVATMERLINFGFDADRTTTDRDSTNGKMSEIAAAFALASIDRLGVAVDRRRSLVERARREFPRALRWQDGVERSTMQFISVALPEGASRSAVSQRLTELGVENRFNFVPLHRQSAFGRDECVGSLANTELLGAHILSLPMYSDMTDDEMSCLIESVHSALDA